MPQAQDNARFVFIVLLIIWLNAGNDNGAGLLSAPSLVAGRLHRQRAAFMTMANSSWGDFDPQPQAVATRSDAATATASPPSGGRYLNLTGFREEDGLAWDDLATFRQRCLEWSRRAFQTAHGHSLWDVAQVVPTWQNATGTVHGPWVRRACSVERNATSYNGSVLTGSATWDRMGDDGYESGPLLEGYRSRAHDRAKNNNGTMSKAKYEDKHVVQWGRNITGHSGRMVVRITDNEEEEKYESDDDFGGTTRGPGAGGLVRTVTATVNMEDEEGTGSSHDMRLHGVHWPHKGALMLATTSEKFAGIFGLPHLAPGEEFFRSSQQLLNRTLDAALQQRERVHGFGASDPSYASPLWTSSVDETPEGLFPAPRCEYVMYLQIHPVETSRVLGRGAKQAAAAAAAAAGTELQEDQSQEQLVAAAIRDIEHELRFPSGAPIAGGGGAVPTMQMSAMLYSPDCAYFIETKGPPQFAAAEGQHLRGLKAEVFIYEARLWMLGYAAVLGVQIKLLLSQVRETYTPSTLGRASLYTVAMMLLADGMVFVSASAWTLTASASFLPSLAVTFAGFLSVAIGGGFLSEIYTAQEPERRRQRRRRQRERQERQQQQQQQQRQVSVPIIVPSDQDVDAEIEEQEAADHQQSEFLLPAPATANAPAASTAAAAAAPDTADTPSPSFSSVAGRLAMLGLGLLFLSLAAMTWWSSARAVYANVLAAAYMSMWVPQIVRNVERNSRRAFAWPFMVGQSAMRLAPVAYFWLRADNVLFARPDRHAFLALAAWVWVQLWVLAFQDVLGPRFGVPAGWAPEAWEYHPVLREDAVEAGRLPIGLVSTVDGEDGQGPGVPRRSSGFRPDSSSSGSNNYNTDSSGLASTNLWTVDCAICCEALDVPVIRMGVEDPTAGGVAGVLARRQYMVTPCRHIFHTACLEGWLRFRLQCPICREELPPL